MWPDLGQVEGVVGRLACVRFRHDLDAEAPPGIVLLLDGVVQVALMALAVRTDDARNLLVGHALDSLHGLEVKLDPEAFILVVDQTERVGAVAVHVPIRPRHSPVGHQNCDLVQAFGRLGPEVPHGDRVAQIGAGVTLLRVDEIRKLVGVAHEEHRGVVAHQVPVSFFGVDLQRESPYVAFGVRRAALSGHRREAQEALALGPRLQSAGLCIPGDVARDAQTPIGRGTLGVHHAFRNSFPVEMGVFLEELPVLDQQRPARSGGQAVLVVGNRNAGSSREGGSVLPGHGSLLVVRRLSCLRCALRPVRHRRRCTEAAMHRSSASSTRNFNLYI